MTILNRLFMLFLLLLFSSLQNTSAQTCQESNVVGGVAGCGTAGLCKVEYVENRVYGCSGNITAPLSSNGALCAAGYSICPNATFMGTRGFKVSFCRDFSIDDLFFASLQSGSMANALQCNDSDNDPGNNIFGCAGAGSTSFLIIDPTCDGLNSVLATDDGVSDLTNGAFGWHVTAPFAGDEQANITKPTTDYGGVLCCRDDPPTNAPTSTSLSPSMSPTMNPTITTVSPTSNPTTNPTNNPTTNPTSDPTNNPTTNPTLNPTALTSDPTVNPTVNPTANPTTNPTVNPTMNPTTNPTVNPTENPTINPTVNPTNNPTITPTNNPTTNPTINPTNNPTVNPTVNPTNNPTTLTTDPTLSPSYPTPLPTFDPTPPTDAPTDRPSNDPTVRPTHAPTLEVNNGQSIALTVTITINDISEDTINENEVFLETLCLSAAQLDEDSTAKCRMKTVSEIDDRRRLQSDISNYRVNFLLSTKSPTYYNVIVSSINDDTFETDFSNGCALLSSGSSASSASFANTEVVSTNSLKNKDNETPLELFFGPFLGLGIAMMAVAGLWLFCLRTQIDTKAADDAKQSWLDREKREFEEEFGATDFNQLRRNYGTLLENQMIKNIELQEMRKKDNPKNKDNQNPKELERITSLSNIDD